MANKKMLKTYHGLPKTPIDNNTIFYASMDGSTVAEVGGLVSGTPSTKFGVSATGLGLDGENNNIKYPLTQSISSGVITLDFILNLKSTVKGHRVAVALLSGTSFSNNISLNFNASTNDLYLVKVVSSGWSASVDLNTYNLLSVGINHIRITVDLTNKVLGLRINGNIVNLAAGLSNITDLLTTMPTIDNVLVYTSNTNGTTAIVSDISVSNIDRGNAFQTLPKDFIDGKAVVKPAFNTQRKVFGDPLTSQYIQESIGAYSITRRKQHTVTQATPGIWASGDTVKIGGLSGEIISGVIDSDTALARINVADGTATMDLDDVSKIIVGDTYTLYSPSNPAASWSSNVVSISGTKVTFANTLSSTYIGSYLFETTTSSSSPTMKATLTGTATAGAASTITLPATFSATDSTYNNLEITITSGTGAGQMRTISGYVGATKVATLSSAWTTNPDSTSVFAIRNVTVNGTWSGLGTTQATFTLGTTTALSNQDLTVEYSLNMVAGQGGVQEVLTTTLGGEINTKLYDSGFAKITSDLTGKVVNSTVENPNKFRKTNGTDNADAPYTPSGFPVGREANGAGIDTLDNTCVNSSVSILTSIAQHLFSFDVIAIVERKYGTIPAPDTAGKVAWLKANVNVAKCSWYGYGTCPSGYKSYLNQWRADSSAWATANSVTSNTSSTPTLIAANSQWISIGAEKTIDSNGFMHFMAYTDASDGVTASTIYTDYVKLDVTLNYNTRLLLSNVPYTIGQRRLTVNPTVHVRDDFYGKIAGSVVENPSIMKATANTSLQIPSASVSEGNQSVYGYISLLDSILANATTSTNLQIPQQLFSFNIIEMLERKFGPLPCGSSLVDKVAWAKANIKQIMANWYGYGLGPLGNRAYLNPYNPSINAWSSGWGQHSNGYITFLSNAIVSMPIYIDSNGFIHFLAYTDPAAQLVSQVPYTPSTWAEWTILPGSSITIDSSGVEFTANGTTNNDFRINMSGIKSNTKYGLLYNVISNNTAGGSFYIANSTDPFGGTQLTRTVGNNKVIATTITNPVGSRLDIYLNNLNTVGTKIKIKDIQVFELPAGSTIESDFNTMTADQLTAKYVFGALPVIPSTIYTDYINLDLVLNTPAGYDVLAPENPRRDDGQSNLLLVRKETKEIQTMFPASNEDGLVIYGDYNTKIASIPNIANGYILTKPKHYLTSLTTRNLPTAYNINTKFDLLDDFSIIDGVVNSSLTNNLPVFKLSDETNYVSLVEEVNNIAHHKAYKRISIGTVNITGLKVKIIDTSGYYYAMLDLSNLKTGTKAIALGAFLAKDDNGQVVLIVLANSKTDGIIGMDSTSSRALVYKLPNNPLIK